MSKENRSVGWGSLSLLLFIISIILLYMNYDRLLIGEHVVNFLNLAIHEVVIAIIFLLLAIFLGRRFPNHLFARSGTIASTVFLAIILMTFLIDIIIRIFKILF